MQHIIHVCVYKYKYNEMTIVSCNFIRYLFPYYNNNQYAVINKQTLKHSPPRQKHIHAHIRIHC